MLHALVVRCRGGGRGGGKCGESQRPCSSANQNCPTVSIFATGAKLKSTQQQVLASHSSILSFVFRPADWCLVKLKDKILPTCPRRRYGGTGPRHDRVPGAREWTTSGYYVSGCLLSTIVCLLFLSKVSGNLQVSPDDEERADRWANFRSRKLSYTSTLGRRSTFPGTFSSDSETTGRGFFYYYYAAPVYEEYCDIEYEVLGNGRCDVEYDFEVCHFDGGDCCEETCIDSEYKCGHYGFDCWDPDKERATTPESADGTYTCNGEKNYPRRHR